MYTSSNQLQLDEKQRKLQFAKEADKETLEIIQKKLLTARQELEELKKNSKVL